MAETPPVVSIWSAITSSAPVLAIILFIAGGFMGLVVTNEESEIKGLVARIEKLENEKVAKETLTALNTSISDRITQLAHDHDGSLAEALHQVHDLESKIVSRDENMVHWSATDALALRVATLSDRMCVPKGP
jgi:hypothetical protein